MLNIPGMSVLSTVRGEGAELHRTWGAAFPGWPGAAAGTPIVLLGLLSNCHFSFSPRCSQPVRQSPGKCFPARMCPALNCLNYVSVYCLSGASSSWRFIFEVGELVPSPFATPVSVLGLSPWPRSDCCLLFRGEKHIHYDWGNFTLKSPNRWWISKWCVNAS